MVGRVREQEMVGNPRTAVNWFGISRVRAESW
jgi:hypothetical protein